MPKPLVLTLAGADLPLYLDKVERSDLYGYVEVETLDEHGRKCSLATLADDGKTIIPTSCSSLAMLSPDGQWLDKKALAPTDAHGNKLTPVPSSYSAPVPLLKQATIDEYLSHNVRSVYRISSDADLGPLLTQLKQGVIFQFPYSFRGGLEPDAGFLLLSGDGTPFLAIGSPTKLEMVGLDQAAPAAADDDEPSEDDDIDFGMM
jgi:hypothetical protein